MNKSPGEKVRADFGRNLRNARKLSNISQRVLTQRMGDRGHEMHQATLSKLEIGQRPVTLAEAVDLADSLGLSLVELLPGLVEGVRSEPFDQAIRAIVRDELSMREATA